MLNKTKENSASSGNRTQAARVAGEHSTTEPTLLVKLPIYFLKFVCQNV